MANDYTLDNSEEVYVSRINDAEADLLSNLGTCQMGIANDTGRLVMMNNSDEPSRAIVEKDGVVDVPGDLELTNGDYIGIDTQSDLMQLNTATLVINGDVVIDTGGNLRLDNNKYIGVEGDTDLINIYVGNVDIAGEMRTMGSIDAIYAPESIIIGADSPSGYTRTDNTDKIGIITEPHYDTDEENTCLIYGLNDTSDNTVNIGGGHSSHNAATAVRIYTAADNTTVTGTERVAVGTEVDLACNLDLNDNDITNVGDITVGGQPIFESQTPPASASATGTAGEIRWDSGYIYVCIATDTWVRAALSTW